MGVSVLSGDGVVSGVPGVSGSVPGTVLGVSVPRGSVVVVPGCVSPVGAFSCWVQAPANNAIPNTSEQVASIRITMITPIIFKTLCTEGGLLLPRFERVAVPPF